MQQQGGGGSQYGGAPAEMPPFAATGTDPRAHVVLGGAAEAATQQQLKLGDPSLGVAEAASPISSRPPAVAGNFEDLLPVSGGGGLPDEDALGGDEADRGGGGGSSVGNRWPRQETLALLKVRSEMDAVFRDATLKGPLWEDVSRKLAELGYKRSAKKCKEKFENVHKYYKRTKEGRAGRQDGKSYRFFSQLEALQRASSSVSATPAILATPTATMPILSTATSATTATANLVGAPATAPVPVSIGIGISNPMPISSIRTPSTISTMPPQPQPATIGVNLVHPQDFSGGAAPKVSGSATAAAAANFGISFSSDSSASSSGSEDMEEEDELEAEEMEMDNEPANTRNRKRRRGSSPKSSTSRRMMEFFEGLMKQVMQKQEAMQKRFLETIEKREQDRMIREEAWKRQEMARLAREHELMAQERAISASRDAAIISFLQKITGQTIQLPHPVTIPADPPPPPIIIPPPPSPVPPPSQQQYQKPQPQQHYQQQQQHHHHHQQQQQQQQLHQSAEIIVRHQSTLSSEIVVAVPEQQVAPQDIGGSGGFEASSSRWPKTEVLALINLRSGLESKYQEAGPKGPLWEEISAGMHRMGYKRSAKRCKEKWENINKYFKKVKESNKKRPEDAKTCPYFHQLDALYQKKIIGNTGTSSTSTSTATATATATGTVANLLSIENRQEQQQMQQQQESLMMDSTPTTKLQERSDVPMLVPSPHTAKTVESEKKDGDNNANLQNSNGGLAATLFGESSSSGVGGVKNPEDTMKEQNGQNQQEQQLMMDAYDKIEEPNSDNLDEDEEEVEEEEEDDDDDDDGDDDDEEAEEQMKMAYKIQFQRQNAGSSNGGGNGAPSFLAMVQ